MSGDGDRDQIPNFAAALTNLGNVLVRLRRGMTKPLKLMTGQFGLKPEYADAYNNRGMALIEERTKRGS